ncbi:MAG: head GIN domain-containing protein [Allosphingosinicella sp.]
MIAASVLVLAACNMSAGAEESGEEGAAGQRDFQVGAFERVSLLGSQDVIVTVGGAPSVRAEGSEKALERLEVRVENGELRIGYRSNGILFGSHGRMTVHVTVPRLTGASIKGSGDIRIDKVEGGDFDGGIAGSGNMEIGAMRVGTARITVAGSGNVSAAGTAEETQVSVAGSGDVSAEGLRAKRAKVSVAGSGDVSAFASESAEVSILGSGDVRIAGTTNCTVTKRGSGSVKCGE